MIIAIELCDHRYNFLVNFSGPKSDIDHVIGVSVLKRTDQLLKYLIQLFEAFQKL